MTFEDTRELLNNLTYARKYAIRQKQLLAEVESDCAALQSPMGRFNELPAISTLPGSAVERAALRLNHAKELFARALNKVYDIEDRISIAINSLTPQEQNIIVDYYMRDRTHEQLAREYHYCDRTIKRIKHKAIMKIADRL